MIHEIDESLRELIKRDALNGANVEISFEAPTRDWASRRKGPALNLYLYDIQEDLERREVAYEEIRNEQGIVVERRMPPRKFRLSYLVTAWTQRPEDEHRLLSAALLCFLPSDALPGDVLQGSLAERPEHIRVTVGLPLPKDRQLSDIWSALGGELKPSLDLVVTAPFDTRRQLEVGPIVTEEPFVRMGTEGEEAELVQRIRRAESDRTRPQPVVTEETVQRGREKAGRKVRIRSLPGP